MDKCINSLSKVTVFPTFDANSAYWQVEVEDKNQSKTEFTSHHGLYRFVHLPFGLKNAPETFRRKLKVLLACFKWPFALAFLDNTVIFPNMPEKHIDHV